jgi:peptide/nickel transport system permease protein
MKYAARRLLHGLLLLIAISILSFAFSSLAPGDFYSVLSTQTGMTPEVLLSMRAHAGLDRPLPLRYFDWVRGAVRGDFGYSLAYGTPVAPLLWQRARSTLLLTGTATLLAWVLALPLAVWNAARRGSWSDRIVQVFMAFLLSIPEMLFAIAVLLVAAESSRFPTGGMTSLGFDSMTPFERVRDLAWHLVLPAVILALSLLPALVRQIRAAMIEVIESPFALAARAHGIPPRRRLFRHILPAALNPIVSLFGLSLGGLLGASLLIEYIVGWPGLGPLFLDSVLARDLPVVVAIELLVATFLIAGNFAADLLLYRADPRIRVHS